MPSWSDSDLRIGCRLLPGRDDDILEFFSKVGPKEKSYEIRRALRLYVQMQTGKKSAIPTTPVIQLLHQSAVMPVPDVSNIQVQRPEALSEILELTDEEAESKVASLLDNF